MRKKNLALALLPGLALNQMSTGTAVAQSLDELRQAHFLIFPIAAPDRGRSLARRRRLS
jgi:hypothetical protein